MSLQLVVGEEMVDGLAASNMASAAASLRTIPSC